MLRLSGDLIGEDNLIRTNEIMWGIMGVVNFAYLRSRKGDTGAAQELLRKGRDALNQMQAHPYTDGKIPYILAQISAIEGNNENAMNYFRKAIDAGWIRPWFARIDPIMADLRKDDAYLQILEELEGRLVEMRERSQILASNTP